MLEMFLKMQNKRRAKGGFTLVELIVVLVILAILAALLIPALTGYIDKAKEKSIIAETRSVVMAAQTLVDEAYATKSVGGTITIAASSADVTFGAIEKLAEVKGNVSAVTVYPATEKGSDNKDVATNKTGKIKTLTYTNGSKTSTYTESASDQYSVK